MRVPAVVPVLKCSGWVHQVQTNEKRQLLTSRSKRSRGTGRQAAGGKETSCSPLLVRLRPEGGPFSAAGCLVSISVCGSSHSSVLLSAPPFSLPSLTRPHPSRSGTKGKAPPSLSSNPPSCALPVCLPFSAVLPNSQPLGPLLARLTPSPSYARPMHGTPLSPSSLLLRSKA